MHRLVNAVAGRLSLRPPQRHSLEINSEVRGGKAPRIKRLSEYIGESYFDYLANLDDLVLLMDESHRYRASAGVHSPWISRLSAIHLSQRICGFSICEPTNARY